MMTNAQLAAFAAQSHARAATVGSNAVQKTMPITEPSALDEPANNGELILAIVDDVTAIIKYRGSDGVLRGQPIGLVPL